MEPGSHQARQGAQGPAVMERNGETTFCGITYNSCILTRTRRVYGGKGQISHLLHPPSATAARSAAHRDCAIIA